MLEFAIKTGADEVPEDRAQCGQKRHLPLGGIGGGDEINGRGDG
jgi:hypothetical protein